MITVDGLSKNFSVSERKSVFALRASTQRCRMILVGRVNSLAIVTP